MTLVIRVWTAFIWCANVKVDIHKSEGTPMIRKLLNISCEVNYIALTLFKFVAQCPNHCGRYGKALNLKDLQCQTQPN